MALRNEPKWLSGIGGAEVRSVLTLKPPLLAWTPLLYVPAAAAANAAEEPSTDCFSFNCISVLGGFSLLGSDFFSTFGTPQERFT